MVEFDELLITTGVDALVRLIKQRKRIELSDAAETLNIPEDTIEEWASILEEQGILKIEYRLTKIFLVWITPTEEEIKAEKEEFYKRRKELKGEIEEIKQRVKQEKAGLEDLGKSFSQLYKKISPKLSDLEKKIDAIQKVKTVSTGKMDEHLERIDTVSSRIGEINQIVAQSKKEIKGISKKMEKGPTKSTIEKLESLAADLKKMKEELSKIKKKAIAYEKGAPAKAEMPRIADIKAKLNQIMKEHKDMRARSSKLREDLLELREGRGVIETIGDSIKGYGRRISSMKKDIGELSKQANVLRTKSEKIALKIEKDKDMLERFSDSMNVAKGIMSRFPSGKNIEQELERMKKSEKTINERAKALKRLLEIASGARVAAVEFEELSDRIDEKMDELSTEIDGFTETLEDEKKTFLAYQSIRERIAPSLEKHKNEMGTLSEQMKKMRGEVAEHAKTLEAEAEKLSKEMKKDRVREVMEVAKEIEEKRVLLDSVQHSIDSLASSSENLSRRLAILSRQAGLLEIRAVPGVAGEIPEKEREEIKEQLTLTRREEEEFRKKREELRNLIKKLWEEEK